MKNFERPNDGGAKRVFAFDAGLRERLKAYRDAAAKEVMDTNINLSEEL